METISQVSKPDVEETELELPPGFRFHPSDEELITHYLTPKVMNISFSAIAIGEVDFNKVEPWDLPWKAKMGEKEWYFFCMKDRKYPTGSRTNRATGAGYWKATGKDKEIFRVKKLVGMKKTLVFYKGRAPKGEKTNWVMHEYRLEGTQSSKAAKNEWVISRIFKKSSGGKKVHISGLLRTSNNNSDDSEASYLPSLMDLSSDDQISKRIMTVESSSFLEDKKPLDNLSINDFSSLFPKVSSQNFCFSSSQFIMPYVEQKDSCFLQEESILRMLFEQNNNGQGSRQQYAKVEISGDTDMSSSPLSNHDGNLRAYGYGDQEFPVISSGPVDLDCFWNC